MENPYGAVPEALKETRLSLRDIMSDFLQNKVLEGRMNLEKTKAETETAMVNAGIEKDRLTNLRELARVQLTRDFHDEEAARQESQFNRTYGLQKLGQDYQNLQADRTYNLQEKAQTLAEKTQTESHEIAEGHLGLARSAEARAGREEARKNETRTASQWAQAAGVNPGLLDFLGISRDMKIKRADAENLYNTLNISFKSNPSLGFMAHGYGLRNDLVDLQTQLKDAKLDPTKRAAIKANYDGKLRQFENLDQLIMAEKTPDQAKIVQTARQTYADNPGLASTHPSFESFLQDFQKSIGQARSVFQDDIQKFRTRSATSTTDETAAEARIKGKAAKLDAILSPQQKTIVAQMLNTAKQKGTWSRSEPVIDRLLAQGDDDAARMRKWNSLYDAKNNTFGASLNQ